MIEKNPQLEQKTTEEIINNFTVIGSDGEIYYIEEPKDKLWTSNESLINLISSLEYHSKEFIIQTLLGKIK